jgi:diguanylate cyclase (GGDEF)-like protein
LEARLEFCLSALEPGWELGVAVVDLDQFKLVNDTYGHPTGDELIAKVAQRLVRFSGPLDEVARFGGDEFVLLLRRGPTDDPVSLAAARIREAVTGPLSLRDVDVEVGASIGLAVTSTSAVSAETLLRNADVAMHRAKERGRNCLEVFDDGLRATVARKLAVSTELSAALRDSGLDVFYQPQIDLRTGELVGFEALTRWERDGASILPDEFIPIAESAGLIHLVDQFCLTTATAQLARWRGAGLADPTLRMSVNISARHLADGTLPSLVESAMRDAGLEPGCLMIEVTETVLMTDVQRSQATLHALRNLGVGVAIDDFGTGYSSLGYLRQLPIDELKVDRAFVATLGPDRPRERSERRDRSASLVAAICDIAHRFGMKVLAEGVETTQQRQVLLELGCDLAQGFLWAPALRASDPAVEQLLRGVPLPHAPSPEAVTAVAAVGRAVDAAGVQSHAPSVRVLVADDNVVLRTAYRRGLERAGFEVVEAADGAAAVALAADPAVRVAVVDNHMGGVSGLSFLAQMRSDARRSGLTVIVVSGTSIDSELELAHALGADAVLRKPVDLQEITRVVRELSAPAEARSPA